MNIQPDSVELVRRAKQGDSDAFGRLYEMSYKRMYRTAFFILRNAEDAEDVVMDTVADAMKGIHALRDDAMFEGWLFRILCNKAKRLAGAQKRKLAVPLEEEIAAYCDPELGLSLDRATLAPALEGLTAQERSILALCVCSNYTSAEAGEILRLNPNTVRSKQLRALEKLRAAIGGIEQ